MKQNISAKEMEYVVSCLNGWLEENSEFFEEEYYCPKNQLVRRFGFGYDTDDNIIYQLGDDYCYVIHMKHKDLLRKVQQVCEKSNQHKIDLILELSKYSD